MREVVAAKLCFWSCKVVCLHTMTSWKFRVPAV